MADEMNEKADEGSLHERLDAAIKDLEQADASAARKRFTAALQLVCNHLDGIRNDFGAYADGIKRSVEKSTERADERHLDERVRELDHRGYSVHCYESDLRDRLAADYARVLMEAVFADRRPRANFNVIAVSAYQYADAMMAARGEAKATDHETLTEMLGRLKTWMESEQSTIDIIEIAQPWIDAGCPGLRR